ncbi:FG-GAP-like repeat-containing protein [Winogradskyella sp. SYSU M77433]|uniref:FG-GAP-like repeat-containing protein n=1 Tax=Winogradskyella sp. SYSU M77433 TaxID=3042722 RepID=UPI00248186B8|nr:FG-GAP-like repeat-containing protein [Winogradskyella sp. SYSU M77433]MDH7914032.1 FG-GAP-like repeat-containing protein [Winogradskyella sp. SYSU M77433]
MKNYFILLILFLVHEFTSAQVVFSDEASVLGIEVLCGNSLYGSGISFFDYDNDGWDDITIGTAQGDNVRFFKNFNGNYIEQSINIITDNTRNKQINWVDIDNDGDNDLFITSDTTGNKLYEDLGNMVMLDITASSGMLTESLVTYGASWGDYNNDGFLDVFVSNRDTSIPNILYKNNGDNTFTIANLEAGLDLDPTLYLSFCSAFIDYNNDGYQDIYVINDKLDYTNTLYENNGDGTFTDVSAVSGTNIAIDAMSATIADYNNDGWLDIYVSNDIPGNVLLKNNGDGTFTNVAVETGTTFNSVAWGAVFLDADNDTDEDLFISGEHNGSIPGYLSSAFYKSFYSEDGIYNFNLNNSSIPNDFTISYSNAIGDVDNDGFPEIIVNNINHNNITLWKNNTVNANNWLRVKLEGTTSNKNGIGSFIEISINGNKQYRYTLCGEGYLSQNSATEFFGLGGNIQIDYIKVTWLSGIEDIIYNVGANQQLNIVEGSTLSLSEEAIDDINLYPNPTSGKLFINSNKTYEKVLIYNTVGQKVKEIKFSKNESSIDMSSLKPGVYFLEVLGDISKQTFRIVKY